MLVNAEDTSNGSQLVFDAICEDCHGTEKEQSIPKDGQPTIYIIRHVESGMIKIGRTDEWSRRSKELLVGLATEVIEIDADFESTQESHEVEQRTHRLLKQYRLPQSEWFYIDKRLAFFAQKVAKIEAAIEDTFKLYQYEGASQSWLRGLEDKYRPLRKAFKSLLTWCHEKMLEERQ